MYVLVVYVTFPNAMIICLILTFTFPTVTIMGLWKRISLIHNNALSLNRLSKLLRWKMRRWLSSCDEFCFSLSGVGKSSLLLRFADNTFSGSCSSMLHILAVYLLNSLFKVC